MVADINGDAVEAAVARLSAAGVAAKGARCDVSRGADVAAAVERARAELGGLDVCVANAGAAGAGGAKGRGFMLLLVS
jgi:NAD(P)-dependent dehydrogenase (short-subunit alcohol dehydrogenase family)